MPWSPAQHRALQAIAHGMKPGPKGPFPSVTAERAEEMARHGVARPQSETTSRVRLQQKAFGGPGRVGG